jgi:hypothetical protein
MKKINLVLRIIFCVVFAHISSAQIKKITIVDKETNLPLENVNLLYTELNEGTFTNSDGIASLSLKNKDLKISIIGYDEISINFEKLEKLDTLFLSPTYIQLKEVNVNSFKLKEAINYVLENYNKLYVDVPFEKECNFKETVQVDNNLKRLILTKVNWWDKSYERKKTDIKLRLGSIEFNKNIPLDIYVDVPKLNNTLTSGYIEPSSLINTIYLNVFLKSFLNFTNNIVSYLEKTNDDIQVVNFESEWIKVGVSSYQHIGTISFDKKTKAIVNISFDTNQKNNIQKIIIKENNKESITETKKNSMRINFSESLEGKLSLQSYDTKVYLNINYNNKTHNLVFENQIFVLKETKLKKVGNEGTIDLTKPIFQSLPSETVSSINSILLSKEENNFIFNFK